MISLIQHFEADFLWKVNLKILNSGIILKTFTHVYLTMIVNKVIGKLNKCVASGIYKSYQTTENQTKQRTTLNHG